MERIRQALAANPDDPQVALECLRLLGELAKFEEAKAMLQEFGADELVESIKTKFGVKDPRIGGLCDKVIFKKHFFLFSKQGKNLIEFRRD